MRTLDNNTERGQAIVYLVLGLVVFFGFVALAIDGGMVLSDRRHVQNAADAASLAGGADAGLSLENSLGDVCDEFIWSCDAGFVISARGTAVDQAIKRAADNGFTIDDNISDHNGVNTFCSGAGNPFIDVTVEISSTTPSNFLQLISPKALHNEVQAITRVFPGGPLAFGNAVVALNPNGCGTESGAVFKGTGDLGVEGGGVWSNGCLQGAGQPTVTISDSLIKFGYAGEFIPGNADWTPSPPTSPTGYQLPKFAYEIDFDINDCDGRWDITIPNNATLDPGLYCMHGDLNINNNQTVNGSNVTFYVEGDVKFNGGATVYLDAPTSDQHDGTIPGVLIYVPHLANQSCYDQNVEINGNNETHIVGSIYAPCSKVTLNGTEDSFLVNSQIIGWNVKVSGTANTSVIYSGCNGYIIPPFIELYK